MVANYFPPSIAPAVSSQETLIVEDQNDARLGGVNLDSWGLYEFLPGTSTELQFMVDLQGLEIYYQFENRSQVIKFLLKNRFLVRLLSEAYSKIRLYFSRERLSIERSTDPEDGDVKLILWIYTGLEPIEASKLLDVLDQDWWLDAMDVAQGRLVINIKFE